MEYKVVDSDLQNIETKTLRVTAKATELGTLTTGINGGLLFSAELAASEDGVFTYTQPSSYTDTLTPVAVQGDVAFTAGNLVFSTLTGDDTEEVGTFEIEAEGLDWYDNYTLRFHISEVTDEEILVSFSGSTVTDAGVTGADLEIARAADGYYDVPLDDLTGGTDLSLSITVETNASYVAGIGALIKFSKIEVIGGVGDSTITIPLSKISNEDIDATDVLMALNLTDTVLAIPTIVGENLVLTEALTVVDATDLYDLAIRLPV